MRVSLMACVCSIIFWGICDLKAKTIIVNDSGDEADPPSGKMTLRSAINSAENGDVISFDDSMAGRSIDFTAGSSETLTIDKDLTIELPEHINGFVTVNGADRAPVFTLNNKRPFPDQIKVRMSKLIIEHGCNRQERPLNTGGGIINHGADLTLGNCRIQYNKAAWGGGMFIESGDYCKTGSVTAVDCFFANNSAETVSRMEGCGGAFYNIAEGRSVFTNCVIESNKADYGGGIWAYKGSHMEFNNCSITDNTALYDGGGFHECYDPLYVNFRKPGNGHNYIFNNCDISRNSSGYYGGGMTFGSDFGKCLFSNCKITSNSVTRGRELSQFGGAGIFSNGLSSFTFDHCLFTGNLIKAEGCECGGAVWTDLGDFTFNSCDIQDNAAPAHGGGIYYSDSCHLAVDDYTEKHFAGNIPDNICKWDWAYKGSAVDNTGNHSDVQMLQHRSD